MNLVPGVSKVTRGIGIPIDGAEKVAEQAEGEAKVESQFEAAVVTFLRDCSISSLLAFPHFFQQYLKITNTMRIRITIVRTSAIQK